VSETLLVKSILGALQLRYKGRLKSWRNNTGATSTASGGFIKFGAVGSPDILGVLSPGGRLVALEVKTARGRTSPAQEAWLSEARTLGAVVGVVRSIDEAFDLIELALQNKETKTA
jgi:VRR-NUC domain